MGRIAELYEKKALGTLTDAEKKELNTLLSEAKMDDGDGDPADPADDNTEKSLSEEIEAASQKMADIFQDKLDKNNAELKTVLEEMKASKGLEVVNQDNKNYSYVVNKELGKKTVGELGDIKIKIMERANQGKKITEVSMRTAEFLKAFMQNSLQPGSAVEKLQILSEGTAADGGYLVPEEFANMIIEDRRDANIMRQIAAPPIQIKTDTFHLPGLVSRPKAQWVAEKAAKNTSTATFTETVFHPYALATIVPLTNQMVSDASLGVGGSVINYLAGLMSISIAEKEEQAFWVGGGSTQPSGVASAVYSSLIRSFSGGLTDTTRADALIQAKMNTPQGYRQRASWVANMGTLGEINRLKDSQNRYLLNITNGIGGQETQTLVGRPVNESNYLGGGLVYFGDWSYYQIVDREGISIKVSDTAVVASVSAFEKNLTFIRVEERVDGQLLLPAAVTAVTSMGTP